MENIKITLAYDGTDFLGWQKTPLGPTVEEALEKALFQILQEKITLQAASRTDAGVHAEGQVVNFFIKDNSIPLRKLQKSLNSLLPKSMAILKIESMPFDFHPTLDNKGKEYQYFICNTHYQKPKYRFSSWHVPTPIDISKMRFSSQFLLGTHDFSSFCNKPSLFDKNPTCTLYDILIEEIEPGRLCVKIIGDRFLFRMVRNIIGTLVCIGRDKMSLDAIDHILQKKLRTTAGITAPAHGLHLIEVFYKKNKLDILSSQNKQSFLC